MSKAIDTIAGIIRDRGSELNQADMREIEYQITQIPLDELADQYGWINEAIALIVNDPAYEGDLSPLE